MGIPTLFQERRPCNLSLACQREAAVVSPSGGFAFEAASLSPAPRTRTAFQWWSRYCSEWTGKICLSQCW